jgi:hypothetical protein
MSSILQQNCKNDIAFSMARLLPISAVTAH